MQGVPKKVVKNQPSNSYINTIFEDIYRLEKPRKMTISGERISLGKMIEFSPACEKGVGVEGTTCRELTMCLLISESI